MLKREGMRIVTKGTFFEGGGAGDWGLRDGE